MTRGGGHGDYHTLVLAPASVQENANMMAEAFDLAEKYRHPVLIASDAAIGQMIEAVEIPEFVEHDINKFDWSIKGCKKAVNSVKFRTFITHILIMKAIYPLNMHKWKKRNSVMKIFR